MIINHPFGGKDLPVLTTPAGVAQILSGYQAINANGEIINGTIPSQGAQTIMPGTSSKTIAAGRYLSGTQTISGDPDLKASNIKSGVNIFGVTGSYSGNEVKFHEATVSEMDYSSDYLYLTVPSDFQQLVGLYYFGRWTNDGRTVAGYFALAFPGNSNNGSLWGTIEENVTSIQIEESRVTWGNDQFEIIGNRLRFNAPWDSGMYEVMMFGASIAYISE